MILLSVIYLIGLVFVLLPLCHAEKKKNLEIIICDCNELDLLQIPAGVRTTINILDSLSTNQNQAFNSAEMSLAIMTD